MLHEHTVPPWGERTHATHTYLLLLFSPSTLPRVVYDLRCIDTQDTLSRQNSRCVVEGLEETIVGPVVLNRVHSVIAEHSRAPRRHRPRCGRRRRHSAGSLLKSIQRPGFHCDGG